MSVFRKTTSANAEKSWFYLSMTLIALYLALAAAANADVTVGRFALFMDERITFDGVKNILHPKGYHHFIWSITDGGDHRYGRSLWNFMALFSFLPERFFGDAGQIFAGRMTGVLILLSAFVLLAVTFVKRWFLRFLLLASLLAMPYTDYYMSMPKPEPLQMLLLAAFLYFFKRNNMSFRGGYWIFLGLAFGTKISTLPMVGVFAIGASLNYLPRLDRPDMNESVRDVLCSLGYFLLGLGLAVPILLPNILFYLVAFVAITRLAARLPSIDGWCLKICLASGMLAVNAISYLFLDDNRTGISEWVRNTFLSTKHGADLASIGVGAWGEFFLRDWMVAPVAITMLFLIISAALAAHFSKRVLRESLATSSPTGNSLPLIVMLAGLALNLAIVTGVHRLWGFYLFPGSVLFLTGLFAIIEHYLPKEGGWIKKRDLANYLSVSGIAVVSVIIACCWFPNSLLKLNDLSHRTSGPQYAVEYSSYLLIQDFLARYPAKQQGKIAVQYDPALFIPLSNAKYDIVEFWTAQPNWKADVVIIGRRYTPKHPPVSQGSPLYPAYQRMLEDYNRNVMYPGSGSLREQRYRRYLELPNGGEVLVTRLD